MQNKFSLDHAQHNEAVCNFLITEPSYADWIITTAFYASLHYVSYKIFPLTINDANGPVTHQTFDSYTKGTPYSSKKHQALTVLVKNNCPAILNQYNQLKDLSWTARYKNYKQSPNLANLAKVRMEEIRDYCV